MFFYRSIFRIWFHCNSYRIMVKPSKLIPYTQRMYKVGYAPGVFGIWSAESLYTKITPPIEGAIEYSHDRTLYLLEEQEDAFTQTFDY